MISVTGSPCPDCILLFIIIYYPELLTAYVKVVVITYNNVAVITYNDAAVITYNDAADICSQDESFQVIKIISEFLFFFFFRLPS